MHYQVKPTITTELQSVSKILQRIDNGEIATPDFQREFVWTNRHIRELFESIYKGYPIGSIMLWRTNDKSIGVRQNSDIPFGEKKRVYPTNFIIDGLQRLSTLYGVLIDYRLQNLKNRFSLVFDLRNERFIHSRPTNLKPEHIQLSAVFSSHLFFEVQRSVSQQGDVVLFQRIVDLHVKLQNYQIPVVNLDGHSREEAVMIFTKLNIQGKRLSRLDLKRALEWVFK